MNQMTTDTSYRKINLEFLNNSGDDPFDIFYKTRSYGTIKYVRFATSKPEHHEKVLRLLESGDPLEDFYILENDLFKYYRHATSTLRNIVANPNISFEKKARKVYEVSKNIMKEFFETNASEKVLRTSEEVMEIMEECFQDTDIGFYGISKITNKDYYTYTHSVNVGLYCMTYGVKISMNHDEVRTLGLGGMLHDVGKSKIDDSILNKKGLLTPKEFQIVKNHAPLGGDILHDMNCYASSVVDMANQHHEKYKGGGYPLGIVGEEISYFARICKVMDVYDALTTRRSYKKAMNPFDTLTLMKKQMSDEFDAKILDDFIRYMGPEL
jgi:HD-GYP domain-containing protein (c-di-GMP phosphodiesterase class II)